MVRRRIAVLVAVGAVVLMAANADAASHWRVNIGIAIPAPVVVTAPPPPPPVYVPPPAPVYVPPPAPVYVPPPVTVGFVWVPSYVVWTGYGYRTVPGAWVRPPYAHAAWVAPHWEQSRGRARGSVWVNGYWRR